MNAETDTLSPYVNTDVKIPRKMLEALTLHEVSCAARGIETVSEPAVRQFLADRFNPALALRFKPEYLISTPSA
jgi:hypothetical protein